MRNAFHQKKIKIQSIRPKNVTFDLGQNYQQVHWSIFGDGNLNIIKKFQITIA